MIFEATPIAGASVVTLERHEDARGWFARTWDPHELANHGLNPRLVQCSLSSNKHKGTLRGMHYSVAPHAEAKLVRCVAGAIYDVLVDLRRESPTYLGWWGQTLTRENGLALFIPEGVAHGFQTLADESDVFYMMTELYDPGCARGVRWNDPAFGIVWPADERTIAERDQSYDDYER